MQWWQQIWTPEQVFVKPISYVTDSPLVGKQHVLNNCQDQIIYWSTSCHMAVTSKEQDDQLSCLHIVFSLYIPSMWNASYFCFAPLDLQWKSTPKSGQTVVRWVIAGSQAGERVFGTLILRTRLLCKQMLPCTNHSERGGHCGSPWQMSCFVWEYESLCSPVKPFLSLFSAQLWRSPSLFFSRLVSALTTSCVSVP